MALLAASVYCALSSAPLLSQPAVLAALTLITRQLPPGWPEDAEHCLEFAQC